MMKECRTVALSLALSVFCVQWGSCAMPPPEFQTVPRSSVIVRIDGRDITKDRVLREAKVLMVLNMNKHRRTKTDRSDNGTFRHSCESGCQRAINRAVVARYAAEHALTNSSATMKRITRQFERQYGVRSKTLKRWHTLDDLKFMVGKNASLLDDEVNARATYHTVTNYIVSSGPIVVADSEVTNYQQSIVRYNARMAQTNAVIFARATNVWQKIVGKTLTFEQAATNFSEDVYIADGCEWGTFSRDQLTDDPELLAILPTLKVGDVTPPVESDGGLAIVRLDEIMENKNFTFSRVFFRLPMFFDEVSAEEARAQLREQAEKKLLKTELDAVRAKMKIEYPSGTNLFGKGCAPLRITKEDLAD